MCRGSDRQSTDLQRDALLAAGVDARHLFRIMLPARRMTVRTWRGRSIVRPGDVLVLVETQAGRSLSHLLAPGDLTQDKRGRSAHSTGNLDTTTPSGEFLFQVRHTLAQYSALDPGARRCRPGCCPQTYRIGGRRRQSPARS